MSDSGGQHNRASIASRDSSAGWRMPSTGLPGFILLRITRQIW